MRILITVFICGILLRLSEGRSLSFLPKCNREKDEMTLGRCMRPFLDAWELLRQHESGSAHIVFPTLFYTRQQIITLCDFYLEAIDNCLSPEVMKSCENSTLLKFVQSQVGFICKSRHAIKFLSTIDCVTGAFRSKPSCRDHIRGLPLPELQAGKCKNMAGFYTCLLRPIYNRCSTDGLVTLIRAIEGFGCDTNVLPVVINNPNTSEYIIEGSGEGAFDRIDEPENQTTTKNPEIVHPSTEKAPTSELVTAANTAPVEEESTEKIALSTQAPETSTQEDGATTTASGAVQDEISPIPKEHKKNTEAGKPDVSFKLLSEPETVQITENICTSSQLDQVIKCLTPLSDQWQAIRAAQPKLKEYRFSLFNHEIKNLVNLCDIMDATFEDCLVGDIVHNCRNNIFMRFVRRQLGFACGEEREQFFRDYNCLLEVHKQYGDDCMDEIRGFYIPGMPQEEKCAGMPEYFSCMEDRISSVCNPSALINFLKAMNNFGCGIQPGTPRRGKIPSRPVERSQEDSAVKVLNDENIRGENNETKEDAITTEIPIVLPNPVVVENSGSSGKAEESRFISLEDGVRPEDLVVAETIESAIESLVNQSESLDAELPKKLEKTQKVEDAQSRPEEIINRSIELKELISHLASSTEQSEQFEIQQYKQPEQLEIEQPEIEQPEQPEIEQPEQLEIEQPESIQQPEQVEIEQPEQSESEQPEQSEIAQPEQPENEQPEQPENEQPEQPEIEQPEQPKNEQPEQAEIEQPEQPEIEQPEQPEIEQPEQSEIKQPEQSEIEQPEQLEIVQPLEEIEPASDQQKLEETRKKIQAKPVLPFEPILSSLCTPEKQGQVRTCLLPLMEMWVDLRIRKLELNNISFPMFQYQKQEVLALCDQYANAFLSCEFSLFETCLGDEMVRFSTNNLGYICSPQNIQSFMRNFDCISEQVRNSPTECLELIHGPSVPGQDSLRCSGINEFYQCVAPRIRDNCLPDAMFEFEETIVQFGCQFDEL